MPVELSEELFRGPIEIMLLIFGFLYSLKLTFKAIYPNISLAFSFHFSSSFIIDCKTKIATMYKVAR